MNKNAIKEFAISARRQLREDIAAKMNLIGITEKEILEPVENISDCTVQYFDTGSNLRYSISGKEIKQREDLVKTIQDYEKESDYQTAYDKILEEVAYTWFNRLIAIRFMEVNDYLPSRIRVLSSEDGVSEPEILRSPFDANIDYTDSEIDEIRKLQEENKLEDLFKFLFIKQCNELNQIFPFLFEETDDYSELLFPLTYTNNEGVIYKLINNIPEEDFDIKHGGQIEIIGWLYQYYNSELREQSYALLKKGKKITEETLPSVTQIYTPDWIVKYMVENTLGRLWIDHLKESNENLIEKKIAEEFNWKYYIPNDVGSKNHSENLQKIDHDWLKNLEPTGLTILDPAMGSGHILVYAFDLLMQIYLSEGYTKREASKQILEKNLYGLDIDDRAAQLAYFSLLMKARNYNRRIFNSNVHVYSIPKTKEKSVLANKIKNAEKENLEFYQSFLENFRKGKLLGSLLKFDNYTLKDLQFIENKLKQDVETSLLSLSRQEKFFLIQLIDVAKILSSKFSVVVTNPPYMGNQNFNQVLRDFIYKFYDDFKTDLFSAFIVRCFELVKLDGYLGLLTPYVWMFIQSYKELRKLFIDSKTIESLVQFEYSALKEATVPICTFILKNSYSNKKGVYIQLTDFHGGMKEQQKNFLKALSSDNCSYLFLKSPELFKKIPGFPITFSLSKQLRDSFIEGILLDRLGDIKAGIVTGNNKKFLKFWFEVNLMKIGFNHYCYNDIKVYKKKWFPYNKGGDFRRWYGNLEYVINLENGGQDIRESNGNYRLRDPNFYFREAISWTKISSGNFSTRFIPKGVLSDDAGSTLFLNKDLNYIIAFTNSIITNNILKSIAPTLNFQCSDVSRLPIIRNSFYEDKVKSLSETNIEISKEDWDTFEISWDFKKHPLIRSTSTIKEAYREWEQEAEERFNQLKANEEELNRIFIKIYGMQNELAPEVDDKYVSVRKADLQREIKSLLSYAVGCVLGRYSLDQEGLAFAGGKWDTNNYRSFIPDADNVIPIIDTNYFEDDIVGLLINWLKIVYGKDTLEENLNFIAEALGKGKNKTSRDVIRDYFLKDFIKDHNKIYQKRPIYWLYDSGRNNGFKALVYMHRYDEDTTGRVAADYLNRMIKTYHNEIARMDHIINNSDNKNEINKAKDRKKELSKQLKECQEYNDRISHLANMRIPIDLDDGVKINHEKIQTDENGNNLKILSKI